MTQTIDKTLAERGSRYGEFDAHADITQGIKEAMRRGRNWEDLPDDMRESLEMVAHKVGRILNGDPDYIDSWTDIIGYTRLVEKRLIAEQATAQSMMANVAEKSGAEEEEEALRNTVSLFDVLFGVAEPEAKTKQPSTIEQRMAALLATPSVQAMDAALPRHPLTGESLQEFLLRRTRA